jgi:hypothetical protein
VISFCTFGTWGDVSPLLEIALQFRDDGVATQFITGPEWVERVESYGITCHGVGKIVEWHPENASAFLFHRLLGNIESMAAEVMEAAKGSAMIVGAVYAWPAQVAAKKLGVHYRATTTTPCYFLESVTGGFFERCVAEAEKAMGKIEPDYAISLVPWFFTAGNLPSPGFPKLRAKGEISKDVAQFIEQPHAVITCGTYVRVTDLDDLIDQIHALGLRCLYIGHQECKADLISRSEPVEQAVAKAEFVVHHAGLGTSVDCLGKRVVVHPVGFDQFYNAGRLIELGAAVDRIADYKSATPTLSNNWSLRAFARLL